MGLELERRFSSVTQLGLTLCQAYLSITNSQSSLRLMSVESVMPSSHLILCRPLLLLPPIPPSIRVFSNEPTLRRRWPKYWSFSFSIIPSKEIPGLISIRMDWLDLLAVPGTLKSLLQHHSSNASILRRSAFFTVQLSHPYMTNTCCIFFEEVPLIQNVQLLFSCSCPGLTRGHIVRSMKSQGLQKEAVFFPSWAPRLAGGTMLCHFSGSTLCPCIPSQGFISESLANIR